MARPWCRRKAARENPPTLSREARPAFSLIPALFSYFSHPVVAISACRCAVSKLLLRNDGPALGVQHSQLAIFTESARNNSRNMNIEEAMELQTSLVRVLVVD